MMGIAFAGLRHDHIYALYHLAQSDPAVRITGAWEADDAARAAAREKIDAPFYPDYDALLKDPQVDIVAIGDYYGIRGERILRALRAGKHVLSDKPLCTRAGELREMERLCREKGLYIGCMLDLRYDPALRCARELVHGGALGNIHAVNFTGQHALNYGVRPAWYFEAGKHGGTINDLAIHGMDAVAMVTGLSYRRTLCARQWNAFALREPGFADCAQFMGEYENGAGLIADVSYSAPMPAAFSLPSYWRFTFWGEGGMLECRLGENQLLLAQAGQEARMVPAPPIQENCLSDLIRNIRGEQTAFPPMSALESARITLSIQEFAKEAEP